MPFGLRSAGQSFQRFMDEVLDGLDFAFCYLDDILIGSTSPEEHLHHLHLVLQRLQKYGLVLNMEKCELARQEIDFLGHHITAEGVSPILKHVQAIQETRSSCRASWAWLISLAFHPSGEHPPSSDERAEGGLGLGVGASHAAQLPAHQGYTGGGYDPHTPGPRGGDQPGCRRQQHPHRCSPPAVAEHQQQLETAVLLQQEA